jgi:hypothetical protein
MSTGMSSAAFRIQSLSSSMISAFAFSSAICAFSASTNLAVKKPWRTIHSPVAISTCRPSTNTRYFDISRQLFIRFGFADRNLRRAAPPRQPRRRYTSRR